jgi:nitrate/nitrite transporter NarK
MYAPMVLINTFTAENKIPGDGYWLSVLNASSILGRLLPGLLADRYSPMTVIIPHIFIAALLCFLFPLFDNVSAASTDGNSSTNLLIASLVVHHCICHTIRICFRRMDQSEPHLSDTIGPSTLCRLSYRWPIHYDVNSRGKFIPIEDVVFLLLTSKFSSSAHPLLVSF